MSAPLLSMAASDAAARAQVLRRLELAIAHRLEGRESGDHASYAYGPGSERSGARPYAPGDDARLVDWNLTARSGQVWVRQTEADRELETWVVVDRSASLDFGTATCEKRDVALGAMAAFGMLTLRGGNRFGVLVAGTDRLRHVPARRGRTAFLASLAAVYDAPRQPGAPGNGATVADALRRLTVVQPRRSQVVVVSDFLGDDAWADALSRVVRHHDVVAVHVTDPRELTLPDVGVLAVVDTETGRQRYVHSASPGLRARYAAAAAARHRAIVSRIEGAGATYLHLSTDRDWLADTVQFAARARRARRARPSDAVIARFTPVVPR
jgi:uncharacterized protein (DUF58 family)